MLPKEREYLVPKKGNIWYQRKATYGTKEKQYIILLTVDNLYDMMPYNGRTIVIVTLYRCMHDFPHYTSMPIILAGITYKGYGVY